jgi:hypothetical protein
VQVGRTQAGEQVARKRSNRKSWTEARVERLTWALLVLAFAIFQLLADNPAYALPNWFVPASGAAVLLGSGLYQYTRRWRVSPVTWIAGSVMLFFMLVNLYVNPTISFLGVSLIVFVLVIVFGLVTNET